MYISGRERRRRRGKEWRDSFLDLCVLSFWQTPTPTSDDDDRERVESDTLLVVSVDKYNRRTDSLLCSDCDGRATAAAGGRQIKLGPWQRT